jgi:hypothetical protein
MTSLLYFSSLPFLPHTALTMCLALHRTRSEQSQTERRLERFEPLFYSAVYMQSRGVPTIVENSTGATVRRTTCTYLSFPSPEPESRIQILYCLVGTNHTASCGRAKEGCM